MDDQYQSRGITLKLGCGACPEQYDAVDKDGNQVGYLRLRHGRFTVECPDIGGERVLSASTDGDGMFEEHERRSYLELAITLILAWANQHRAVEENR
jgi:hypothetical protein